MHVAVLGAGYAGVVAARRLERSLPEAARLTVVNETDYHLVQHEIHRVLRRPSLAADLRVPLDEVLDRAEIRVDRVTDVDPEAGVARLAGGRLDYDYGIVCLGAAPNYHGLPGVAEHGLPLKRLEHAERIRSRFRAAAGDAGDAGGAGSAARVVVGGAGLSGVQVAGELAEAADEEGYDADVVLLERLDDVAPAFPEHFRDAVHQELTARGVGVRTGAAVERAGEEALELATGERVPHDLFVWSGGIRGSDAMDGDRPETRSDLRAGDGTFVAGDAARVIDVDGEPAPASAQSAIRQARVAAANVAALASHGLDGDAGGFEPRLDRYAGSAPGWVVSVGDGAVAQVGPSVLRGRAARAAKASIGAKYLGSDVGSVDSALEYVREEFRSGGSRGRSSR